MFDYDVVIVGGAVSGPCAAKDLAAAGLRTLLIEKYKVPRDKSCSGIQWPYFEKLIGEKIPKERLCNYQIEKVVLELPDGFTSGGPTKMLNFMRKPLDEWMCNVAQEKGAIFWDETNFIDYTEKVTHIEVEVIKKGDIKQTITTKYLIDATGLRPVVRKKLRPEDFSTKSSGATLNYYIDGTCDADPEALYQFWRLEFNDAMFAWLYTKTLDDGKDYWVVGTGCNFGSVKDRQELLYKYVQEKFNLKGEIVKREGYSTNTKILSDEKVWLGQNHILMVGDAAGLIDMARGVGMDAAAISGRLAARAIIKTELKNSKKDALTNYTKLMRNITKQTRANQKKDISQFETNEQLTAHMKGGMLKLAVKLIWGMFVNKFKRIENIILLPPA